jgi:hypothetical protein
VNSAGTRLVSARRCLVVAQRVQGCMTGQRQWPLVGGGAQRQVMDAVAHRACMHGSCVTDRESANDAGLVGAASSTAKRERAPQAHTHPCRATRVPAERCGQGGLKQGHNDGVLAVDCGGPVRGGGYLASSHSACRWTAWSDVTPIAARAADAA